MDIFYFILHDSAKYFQLEVVNMKFKQSINTFG